MNNILTAKVYQGGEDAPVLTMVYNPLNVEVVNTERVGEGNYIVTIDKPVLNSDIPGEWNIADSTGARFNAAAINQTQIALQSFNKDGVPSDGIFGGNQAFKIYLA